MNRPVETPGGFRFTAAKRTATLGEYLATRLREGATGLLRCAAES